MSDQPKPSRMEQQIRNQSRGLFWVSAALLIACMTMTGLFGWSFGNSLVNKAVFAMGLGAADLGGAYLIATCGTCLASKQTGAGIGALLAALVCFVVTLTGIIGFQSENREGQAQSRERATKLADTWLDFTTSATAKATQDAKGKSQSQAFAVGIESVGKAVKDQIAMLQSGELAPLVDGQATTIARLSGCQDAEKCKHAEAAARSWAISGTSGALLFIQYACLWFYGFLRHRLEPILAAQNVVGRTQFNGVKAFNSSKSPAFSEESARERLDLLLAGGFQLDKYGAYSFLGREFGWTTPRTIRWLERQSDLTIKAKRRRKSVQNGDNHAPILNGRAHAV